MTDEKDDVKGPDEAEEEGAESSTLSDSVLDAFDDTEEVEGDTVSLDKLAEEEAEEEESLDDEEEDDEGFDSGDFGTEKEEW